MTGPSVSVEACVNYLLQFAEEGDMFAHTLTHLRSIESLTAQNAALVEENNRLREAVETTRALVAKGASDGFTDHVWMQELFENQRVLTSAFQRNSQT